MSDTLSQPPIHILTSKPTSSIFTNIFESIMEFFRSDEIIEPKIRESKDLIRINLCHCPKTKSRDYCDNIYEILQMTKNTNNKRSKELYLRLLQINDNLLDSNGDNLRQIRKGTCRTYRSSLNIESKDLVLQKLENVLRAFSAYDNTMKYCQGMNFIVGFLSIIFFLSSCS